MGFSPFTYWSSKNRLRPLTCLHAFAPLAGLGARRGSAGGAPGRGISGAGETAGGGCDEQEEAERGRRRRSSHSGRSDNMITDSLFVIGCIHGYRILKEYINNQVQIHADWYPNSCSTICYYQKQQGGSFVVVSGSIDRGTLLDAWPSTPVRHDQPSHIQRRPFNTLREESCTADRPLTCSSSNLPHPSGDSQCTNTETTTSALPPASSSPPPLPSVDIPGKDPLTSSPQVSSLVSPITLNENQWVRRSSRQAKAVCQLWYRVAHPRATGARQEQLVKQILEIIANNIDLRDDPVLLSASDDNCVLWHGEVDKQGCPILRINGHYAWVANVLAVLFAVDDSLMELDAIWSCTPKAATMQCRQRCCVRVDHISTARHHHDGLQT